MTDKSSEETYQGHPHWTFEFRFWMDTLLIPAAGGVLYAAEQRFDPEEALRDPASMLMHLIGIVLLVRGLLRLPALASRLRILFNASRFHLRLTENAMEVVRPGGNLTLPRDRFLGAVEEGDWRQRKAGPRWSFVHGINGSDAYDWHVPLPRC